MLKQSWLILAVFILVSCSKGEPGTAFKDLPEGDTVRGAALFTQTINESPACNSCHRTDDVTQTGPGLADFSSRAEERDDKLSAAEYTYYSILRPSRAIVTGFSNVMYSDYEEKLTPQQIADLIAFVLSL